MKRQPQISENLLIPLLELDEIEKGRKIYQKNDGRKVHWELTSYKVKGVDESKQMLLCEASDKTSHVIPFSELSKFYVLKFGFAPQNLVPLDFRVIDSNTELSKRDKLKLHEFASPLVQGTVGQIPCKDKAHEIWVACSYEFHQWYAKQLLDSKTIFIDLNRFSSQCYYFDSEEQVLKIMYRKKTYTLTQWAEKLNQ